MLSSALTAIHATTVMFQWLACAALISADAEWPEQLCGAIALLLLTPTVLVRDAERTSKYCVGYDVLSTALAVAADATIVGMGEGVVLYGVCTACATVLLTGRIFNAVRKKPKVLVPVVHTCTTRRSTGTVCNLPLQPGSLRCALHTCPIAMCFKSKPAGAQFCTTHTAHPRDRAETWHAMPSDPNEYQLPDASNV